MATITKRNWQTPRGERREAWVLSFMDATGKRHREQHARKRDAEAARIKAEGQVSTGTFRGDSSKYTVQDACDVYLKYLEARQGRGEHVTATYLATTKSELHNYVLATAATAAEPKQGLTKFSEGIGQVKLSQLSSSIVGNFAERMRAAGASVSATRRAVAALARALSFAVSKDMVGTNAAKGIKVIGTRNDGPKKIKPPSKIDLREMLEKSEPDLRMRLLFAASTGLRASEQWALRWHHLNLEDATVKVEVRLDRYGNEDTTKSDAGCRTVPLGKSMIEALKSWRERSEHSEEDDLVFPNSKGGYTSHGNLLKREYKVLLAKLKGEKFNWHALRHYAVSTWIEAGLPPKTIQTFAGHATLAITMDRYGHLFASEDHTNVMDRIAKGLVG